MCFRHVTYSCSHTWYETMEPLDLSLILQPSNSPQRCWRCRGEARPSQVSYYGDHRIEFHPILAAPAERRSGVDSPSDARAPATTNRANTASCDGLSWLFVKVLDTRDLPEGSPYAGRRSEWEILDAGNEQTHSSSSTSGTAMGRTNRSAQATHSTLRTGHDKSSMTVPDVTSSIGHSTFNLRRCEPVTPRLSGPGRADDSSTPQSLVEEPVKSKDPTPSENQNAETETRTRTSMPVRPSEGSEIEFPGLSIRPDGDKDLG